MFPPNQGSSLFQDSSLNMTPRKNCNISGYKDPNENFQEFIDRERTLISVVKCLDSEGETVTRVFFADCTQAAEIFRKLYPHLRKWERCDLGRKHRASYCYLLLAPPF